jgi:hypothetical protein
MKEEELKLIIKEYLSNNLNTIIVENIKEIRGQYQKTLDLQITLDNTPIVTVDLIKLKDKINKCT